MINAYNNLAVRLIVGRILFIWLYCLHLSFGIHTNEFVLVLVFNPRLLMPILDGFKFKYIIVLQHNKSSKATTLSLLEGENCEIVRRDPK